MKSKILYIILFFLLNIFIHFKAHGVDQFNFDVTEVEILKNGDIIKGLKKGTVNTADGVTITADTFVYDKLTNILTANGEVEIIDPKQNLKIYSDNAIYQKNEEIITTNQNSKAIYGVGKFMYGDTFKVYRKKNILNAKGNVKIENTIDDHIITGNDFTYFKNSEKIISKGDTKANIRSEYKISSKDITYLIDEDNLSSENKTKVEDQNSNVYFVERFNYQINEEILKGEKFLIITNYNLPKSDQFFFENAIFNLKDQTFVAKETEVYMYKDIFDVEENDPRIKGVSSSGDGNITTVNKGVFTACKENDDCPPWSIKAEKVKHDKNKKRLIYDNAIFKVYDFPVFYFPKFFHPDPTVERQSGFLKHSINSSNVMGSSLATPYFKVISENKDLTLTPTLFDSNTEMISAEYRQTNKSSNFLLDTGFVNGYKSPTTKKKNSLNHIFFEFNKDLELENFISSKLKFNYEKTSFDNYLPIFQQYLTKSEVRPRNLRRLDNKIELSLDHENYNFTSGMKSYENLKEKKQNDRYSYNLPYYKFSKNLDQDFIDGNISFSSSGNNNLQKTNQLKSNITNNLRYNSLGFITNLGFKSNFGANIKNLNAIGKNSTDYKSSPQMELLSIYNLDIALPLIKDNEKSKNLLTPKLSFRINPSDMKNHSSSSNLVNVNNIFSTNRLGISDYESGRSLTLGLNYKKEIKDTASNLRLDNKKEAKNDANNLSDINRYFEAKFATVLRDKKENFIPNRSSLHRTNSNLFGSLKSKFSDNLTMGYNFSLDNDYNTLEHNNIKTIISVNNIVTTFNFLETNGERGDTNYFATKIDYALDEKNSLLFKTRRNRKINLTEYYDLVYEYKNDCLTAGMKYRKTYYSDGDLKPTENLLFTITLFPLTTHEYDAEDDLRRLRGN